MAASDSERGLATAPLRKTSVSSNSAVVEESPRHEALNYCNFEDFLEHLGLDHTSASGLTIAAAQQMFSAPLPPQWSEQVDETSSRVYFFNRATGDSLWMHPQKSIFEDLLQEVQCWQPDNSLEEIAARADAHLRQAQRTAVEALAQWSAFDAPQGPEEAPEFAESSQFYFNATTGGSSWADPRQSVEFDLRLSDARHEPDVADVAVAEGLTGKREREEDGPAESRKAPQPSAIHLPPISHAATAPGNLCDENEDLQSILESSNVKALKDRLRSEMTLHEQTRNHAKELEKRLQLATKPRSSQKPRFGITSTTPYDRRPREKSREKRSERSVVLPPLKPLKSAQSSRSPKRSADGALRNVHEMLKDENMSVLSRGGQSRTRLQAYGRLTRAGLSTWDVRLDEKISRFQDMRAFSDSMWNSFHDWNTQYHSVG